MAGGRVPPGEVARANRSRDRSARGPRCRIGRASTVCARRERRGSPLAGRRTAPCSRRSSWQGASLSELADALGRSIATVRHWLRRWEIERTDCRRKPPLPPDAPPEIEMRCWRHGVARFRLDRSGSYRCKRCAQERVAARRRKVKRILVAEAGGRCRLCGYDRCVAALQFHHPDPCEKSFAVSHRGATRSLGKAREEARKCVLLCANCHAEVEAGYRSLEAA
jgi:Homeodomain-like domain-containing protein